MRSENTSSFGTSLSQDTKEAPISERQCAQKQAMHHADTVHIRHCSRRQRCSRIVARKRDKRALYLPSSFLGALVLRLLLPEPCIMKDQSDVSRLTQTSQNTDHETGHEATTCKETMKPAMKPTMKPAMKPHPAK